MKSKNKKYTCTFPTTFKYRIVHKNWRVKDGDLVNYRHPLKELSASTSPIYFDYWSKCFVLDKIVGTQWPIDRWVVIRPY